MLLAYPGERLHSPAPCDPSPAFQEVVSAAMVQGPALDAYRTATAQLPTRQAQARTRWPDFADQTRDAGYHYTCALPMRLHQITLGSLLLLHTALHSRIVIEQAKGVLAARRNTSLNHAFNVIRHHARSHGRLLTTVARDVIEHGLLASPDGQHTDTSTQ